MSSAAFLCQSRAEWQASSDVKRLALPKAVLVQTSSEPLRDGASGSAFSSFNGRTSNLVAAIRAHKSKGSKANKVINQFDQLTTQDHQQIIDFLRAL